MSYGESEVGNTVSWIVRMNQEFQAGGPFVCDALSSTSFRPQLMGLRGISVLFAAGDRWVRMLRCCCFTALRCILMLHRFALHSDAPPRCAAF